jgi:hypothetical protein
MDEHELAKRAYALPAVFADRLDPADLATLREYAEVGEWGEEIDLLLVCLSATHQSVTTGEQRELLALLKGMGLPSAQAEELPVVGP